MADEALAAGARYLVVGQFHKISTLIGSLRLSVPGLREDVLLCDRGMSYRGDTDEAFDRAAVFALREIGAYCLP